MDALTEEAAAGVTDYGVKTENLYGLLREDDEEMDPAELVRLAQERQKAQAEAAAAAKKKERKEKLEQAKRAAKNPGAPPANAPPANLAQNGRRPPNAPGGAPGGPGAPGGVGAPRGRGGARGRGGLRGGGPRGGGPRPPRPQQTDGSDGSGSFGSGFARNKPAAFDGSPPATDENGGGGFGGGFGSGFDGPKEASEHFGGGGRGQRRPVPNRGRQFDRRSGSDQAGPRGFEKRGGHGRGNWGTAEDELAGETEPLNESGGGGENEGAKEGFGAGFGEKKEGEKKGTESEEEKEPKEKEPEVLTLDEYKAKMGARDKPKFNIRKPGEGEKKDAAKLVPLQAKKPESTEEEYIVIEKPSKKQLVNLPLKFTDPPSRGGGGERGGRGGFRGGRGRGGGGGGAGFPTNEQRRSGPAKENGAAPTHFQAPGYQNAFPALA